jgi:hypothetical protein
MRAIERALHGPRSGPGDPHWHQLSGPVSIVHVEKDQLVGSGATPPLAAVPFLNQNLDSLIQKLSV